MKAEFKLEGFDEVKKMVDSNLFRKALRSTLDRGTTKAKQEIVKAVSEAYHIQPKDVREVIAVRRTSMEKLETIIRVARKKLSLAYFRARQAPKGALANVRKAGVSFYPSAFVIRKYGGKVYRRKGAERFPIKHLAGPAVTEIVKMDKIMSRVKEKAYSTMNKLFHEEITKRISRMGKH